MDTIKNAVNRRNNIAVLLFMLLVLAFVFVITGCGSKEAVASDPNASAAAVDKPAEETTERPAPPAVDDLIKQFGEVVTYEDGVSISISAPTPFTPSNIDYMPLGAGETAVVFKVVLTNGSDKPFEPGAIPQANSGGKPASYIADVGNPEYGDLGLFPTAAILPGQTLEWFTAFGVVDPADITLQITPGPFVYDTAIFTNVAF